MGFPIFKGGISFGDGILSFPAIRNGGVWFGREKNTIKDWDGSFLHSPNQITELISINPKSGEQDTTYIYTPRHLRFNMLPSKSSANSKDNDRKNYESLKNKYNDMYIQDVMIPHLFENLMNNFYNQ